MYTPTSVLELPLQSMQIEIEVSFYGKRASVPQTQILRMPAPAPIPRIRSGGPIYFNLATGVEVLDGYPKQVMTDLYRKLVLGHFSKIANIGNGEIDGYIDEGSPANNAEFLQRYPDNKTIPWFIYDLSTKTNTYGLIAYNLVEHEQIHLSDPDYRMLGALFHTMINRKALGSSVAFKVELNQSSNPMTRF